MTADTSWLESMPEVYDRCLGLAVFAPFARRARAPGRRPEPAAGCWRSPPAPASSPPGWWRRCPTPRSPRPTSTRRWSTTPPPASPGPTLAGRRRPGPRPRRRRLRPRGLPVRRDVLPQQDRRLPGGAPGAGAARVVPLQRVGHPGHLRAAGGRVRRPGRGPPRQPAGLRRADPARVRRPDADQGRRPGRQASRSRSWSGSSWSGSHPRPLSWPRASASARRCASSCRSAATSPTSSRRSRR